MIKNGGEVKKVKSDKIRTIGAGAITTTGNINLNTGVSCFHRFRKSLYKNRTITFPVEYNALNTDRPINATHNPIFTGNNEVLMMGG